MSLLNSAVQDWVHDLCERWCIPGLSVSVVNHAPSGDKGQDPATQFLFHGIRNARGQPYQDKVGYAVIITLASLTHLVSVLYRFMLQNLHVLCPGDSHSRRRDTLRREQTRLGHEGDQDSAQLEVARWICDQRYEFDRFVMSVLPFQMWH